MHVANYLFMCVTALCMSYVIVEIACMYMIDMQNMEPDCLSRCDKHYYMQCDKNANMCGLFRDALSAIESDTALAVY